MRNGRPPLHGPRPASGTRTLPLYGAAEIFLVGILNEAVRDLTVGNTLALRPSGAWSNEPGTTGKFIARPYPARPELWSWPTRPWSMIAGLLAVTCASIA